MVDDNEWRPYVGDRLRRDLGDRITVIIPKEHSDPVPLGCPVCGTFFSTFDDERAYTRFKCCASCADKWAYPNAEKWLQGWRPETSDIDK